MSVEVETKPREDYRLGRIKVHDDASRAFPMRAVVDRSTWRDKAIRIYDPTVNPNQCHGECTGCAKMMQLNAVGNRKAGRVLGMDEAHRNYSRNTEIDPWSGSWPPDDTGSSGLASAKSAAEHGLASPEYRWIFGGADEVVQNVMEGFVISSGTWWHAGMFGPSGGVYAGLPIVTPTGGYVGGHQYVLRGYNKSNDLVMGRCWWGGFRDFWIKRLDLDTLLRDGGDAHFQRSIS